MTMTFKEFLYERVLSIGLNPEHEKHREAYRDQLHDIIRDSYSKIGYGGLPTGSPEESQSIHDDITNSAIKTIVRDGKVKAAIVYKMLHGRKGIAIATDGTKSGKEDMMSILKSDAKFRRSWMEVSGAPEKLARNLNMPTVPAAQAQDLLNKPVDIISPTHYSRKLGPTFKVKTIVGYPKK